jgi:hypothetical protein
MTATERQARQETWAERIAEFEASGLSGAKWCAARGLKEHQLSYWRRKLKHQAEQKEIRWLPVDLSAPEPALTIKIGPASIELRPGFDQELFIKAVKLLSML